nr:hypothetical protein [Tanacetum cinerariifolium]
IRRWRYNLIPAKSRFKTSCSINKDTFKMKAQKTCNNDKNLSEVQLEHEKEDEFVVVVVKDGGEGDCKQTLGGRGGFLEKLEWWFEQDIDKEEERFEGDEDRGEV